MDEDGLPIVGSGIDLTKVSVFLLCNISCYSHDRLTPMNSFSHNSYVHKSSGLKLIITFFFLRFQPFNREES